MLKVGILWLPSCNIHLRQISIFFQVKKWFMVLIRALNLLRLSIKSLIFIFSVFSNSLYNAGHLKIINAFSTYFSKQGSKYTYFVVFGKFLTVCTFPSYFWKYHVVIQLNPTNKVTFSWWKIDLTTFEGIVLLDYEFHIINMCEQIWMFSKN